MTGFLDDQLVAQSDIWYSEGRLATVDDLKAGSAAFFIGSPEEKGARPLVINLPGLGRFSDDDGSIKVVVVIQAKNG